MSSTEEQNQRLLSKSHKSPDLSNVSRPESRQENFVSSNFPCNFLYACENCDGPLAPIAVCLVCKRATLRKCLHCQRDVITGTHLSCSTLIFFAKKILHTHQTQKVVNI